MSATISPSVMIAGKWNGTKVELNEYVKCRKKLLQTTKKMGITKAVGRFRKWYYRWIVWFPVRSEWNRFGLIVSSHLSNSLTPSSGHDSFRCNFPCTIVSSALNGSLKFILLKTHFNLNRNWTIGHWEHWEIWTHLALNEHKTYMLLECNLFIKCQRNVELGDILM